MPGKYSGQIKWFSKEKGYGFLKREDGSPDTFIHIRDVEKSGIGLPREGDKLTFDIESGPKGEKAVNIARRE